MAAKTQAGWFLFEMLLASIIGFFVLAAALQFFFTSCAALSRMANQWHRIELLEKWRLWMSDSLNAELASSRCGHSSEVGLSTGRGRGFMLHSCCWVNQRWQWVDSRYYVKKKRGVSYLYEKIVGKPGVAWIPGVIDLHTHLVPINTQKKCHRFAVDWTPEKKQDPALASHFVFCWCNEKA